MKILRISIIALFAFVGAIIGILILQSCEKDEDNNNVFKKKEYFLKITQNSEVYYEYKYTDSKMIYFKDLSGAEYRKWRFEYNASDELINVHIHNEAGEKVKRFKFEYNSEKHISSMTVYKYDNGNDSLFDERAFIYDEKFRLIEIDAFLPETFEYEGLDIIKHGKVNDGIWTDYQYFYDNKNNVLAEIGMPEINPVYISEHNIDSVVAYWTEHVDNMGIDSIESRIKHEDVIYSSNFEYNKNNNPKVEYRHYSNYKDILEYNYDTIISP